MRKFLLLMALIISGLGLNAQSVGDETIINYDGYSLTFTVTKVSPAECSVICSKHPTSSMAVTIPASVEIEGTNFNVTSIGDYAFQSCSNLTSIEIPSGVTSIGEYAFYSCSSLASVTFGENSQLTSIGNYAFSACYALTSIEIPSGVTSIGGWAFSHCSSLTSIEIPSGVTSIGDEAFCYCSSLYGIRCHAEAVPTTGSNAFASCPIKNIQVPAASVELYEDEMPWNSFNITEIYPYMPGDVAIIDYTNYSLKFTVTNVLPAECEVTCSTKPTVPTAVEIPSSVKFNEIDINVTAIKNYAFRECSSLTSIEIPSGVTSIGESAFYYCSSLTSIEIPSGVTSIGNSAFGSCSNLETVTFGENSQLTSIGDEAFYYCSSLYGIRCHAEAVPNTGNYVFDDCPIKNIQVPAASVELYKAASPWNNYNITEIYPYYIGDVVTIEYEGYSLEYTIIAGGECEVTCSTKPTVPTAVEIPSTVEFNGTDVNVTTIKNYAFCDCPSLTSIEIPSGVTSIGEWAFYQCSSLTSIEIPSGVTSIGDYAFYQCSSLYGIRCHAEAVPTTIGGSNVFYGCNNIQNIQVPAASVELYKAASPWNNYNITEIFPYYIGDVVTIEYEGYSLKYTIIAGGECDVAYGTKPTSPTAVEIPSSVKFNEIDINVTTIKSDAFTNCTNLKSITIPSSIDSIGYYYSQYDDSYSAFSSCSNLETVTFAENSQLTSIPHCAFSYCSSITSIEIPSGVTSIGNNAFQYCSNLESVTFGENSQLTSIGEYAFYYCPSLTSIEIPSGVTSIGSSAFYNCSSLTSIEIPSGVTSIGDFAFSSCSRLESVSFGENSLLTSIPYRAFYECSSLTSIEIPSGVTSIGDFAFYYCSNLERVSLPNTLISIGDFAFYSCDAMVSVNIPNSLETMGVEAYASCDNLIKVTFEDNSKLTSISSSAFSSCNALKTVTFGENSQLTSIGGSAFSYCSSLTSIEIPSGVTSIGDYAFNYCPYLKIITFAENSQLDSIGQSAFRECYALTSIEIPSSVASIGDYAFNYCYDLENVTFAENSQLTSIGSSAFNSCSSLESIEIPSGVTEIKKNTFENCSGLLEVKLPASVIDIKNFAFRNCQELESVVLAEESQLKTIGDLAFNNCKKLYQMEIPRGVYYIGYLTFENCSSLIIIESHAETVPQTDNEAFKSCPENMRISVPAGSVELYEAAEPWNYYTIVTEIIQHDIAVSLNLEGAGTIEGAGTYFEGETVTLVATANEYSWENYTFAYWSENGAFVSDEAEYTFVAEADRNLVANFMTDNHWDPEEGNFTLNATITADVQLENVSPNNINIEIGAFCGNELRGSARLRYFGNKFLYHIVIYGEDGDIINFRLYDHNTKEEMEYLSDDYVVYADNEMYGSSSVPMVINFEPVPKMFIELMCNIEEACNVEGEGYYQQGEEITITANHVDGFSFKNWTLNGEVVSTNSSYTFTVQSTQSYIANYEYAHEKMLSSGWNWYSTYISLSGASGLNTIQTALGTAASQIKSNTEFDTYEHGEWIGSLDEASTDKMYMIDMAEDEYNLVITGTVVNPQECPITINKNWNWISYPVNSSMSISDALAGFTPQHEDYIKSQTEFSQYSEGNGWLGPLQVLEPGEGYMYHNASETVKTLRYANPTSKAELAANITTENNYWSVNATKYPTNMNIIAVVESNGEELSDYEIGAFCEGECRGSARPIYIDKLDRYMIFLTVFGEGEEEISFRLYDVLEEEEHAYTSNESMVFGVNSVIGSVTEPYELHFGILGLEENMSNTINVYPNPAGIDSEIYLGTNCDKVEIYNTIGVKIAEYDDVEKIEGINTAGVYIIKTLESNNISYSRIVVR